MVGSIVNCYRMFFDCKMKKILLLSLIVATLMPCKGQSVAEIINRSTADIKTLECEFVQENHLMMLSDVIKSYGKMYYSGGNKLRWEYTSPYTYTFILSGDEVILRKNGRQDVIDVNQNKMFKEIARIMMNSVLGKSLGDEKSFKTEIEDKGASYEAKMIPLKKDMQQIFPSITLCYDKKEKIITRVVLHQKNGDYTEIILKNIKRNITIDEKVFSAQ